MTDFNNENRGAIWKNEKRAKDTHADFTGELDVNGTKFYLNAWKRKPEASEKAPALTFSIKPKSARQGDVPF